MGGRLHPVTRCGNKVKTAVVLPCCTVGGGSEGKMGSGHRKMGSGHRFTWYIFYQSASSFGRTNTKKAFAFCACPLRGRRPPLRWMQRREAGCNRSVFESMKKSYCTVSYLNTEYILRSILFHQVSATPERGRATWTQPRRLYMHTSFFRGLHSRNTPMSRTCYGLSLRLSRYPIPS